MKSLLDAEAKIGELLKNTVSLRSDMGQFQSKSLPKGISLNQTESKIGELLKIQNPLSLRSDSGQTKKSLPAGISLNQSSQFQTMAENPEP